jgi:hypothetical protein
MRSGADDRDPRAELQRQLAGDPVTDEAVERRTSDDDLIDSALDGVGVEALSDEARAMLLAVTDQSEGLEPSTRQRLVAAAERGLHSRRQGTIALPLVLFNARRGAGQQLDEVASAVEIPPAQLQAIETGTDKLNSISAEAVATWIAQFDITIEQAQGALYNTFVASGPTRRAAGRSSRKLSVEDSAFVEQVVECLKQLGS